jgi:hypothetical protein
MVADGSPERARLTRMQRRALALWPRLDMRALTRCGDDARCIVRVVSRRTALPADAIHRLLFLPAVSEDEGSTWFG